MPLNLDCYAILTELGLREIWSISYSDESLSEFGDFIFIFLDFLFEFSRLLLIYLWLKANPLVYGWMIDLT